MASALTATLRSMASIRGLAHAVSYRLFHPALLPATSQHSLYGGVVLVHRALLSTLNATPKRQGQQAAFDDQPPSRRKQPYKKLAGSSGNSKESQGPVNTGAQRLAKVGCAAWEGQSVEIFDLHLQNVFFCILQR